MRIDPGTTESPGTTVQLVKHRSGAGEPQRQGPA
jgi:hypothetical protein